MFDSHVHFDAEPFLGDLDRLVRAAQTVGVTGALNPAVDLESSRRALEIHRARPWILPAFGIHPLYLTGDSPPLCELEELAAEGAFAAVGEVGLDFWHGRQDEERQRAFLDAQARMAARLGLPIALHVRKGFYEAFAVLRESGFVGPGVAHAFTGSRDMARLALDRGFYLSACAVLTRPDAGALRQLFRWAPKERILVETDAPDLPPWTRRGQLHRPEDLPLTVAALAGALSVPFAEAARITSENAEKLFGKPNVVA